MRYHHEEKQTMHRFYGTEYKCDHPAYTKCTLYLIGSKGLAVVQQRYDPDSKKTWWDCIDDELIDQLYLHPKFKGYFDSHASEPKNDIYPTVTIRQIMWGLRMKPLKRHPWETVFDHCPI